MLSYVHNLERIKNTHKEFDEKLMSLRKRIDQTTKAPLEDVRRLKEKYGLSAHGVENITQMLLGAKISQAVQKVLVWYKRLKPVVERARKLKGERKEVADIVEPIRASGVDVRFKEYTPLPDFLIRLLNVSLRLQVGDLAGKIRNVTPDQDVLGTPLTFAFSGDKLKGLDSVKLEGELNYIDPSKSKDAANLQVYGYRVQDLVMSENKELPIVLKKALADLRLHAKLSGEVINANLLVNLQSAMISTGPKKDAGSLAEALASLLSGIRKMDLKVDVSGTLDDYDLRLSSDLDRVLKDAIGKQVKEHTAHMEERLKAGISEKMKGPIGDLRKSLGEFYGIGDELASRLQSGSSLVTSSIQLR